MIYKAMMLNDRQFLAAILYCNEESRTTLFFKVSRILRKNLSTIVTSV